MSQSHEDEPHFETQLEDPAYRERLRRKLDCLVAVLEVACAKVRRTLETPGSDRSRLERIQKNLGETLATCKRARLALDRRERLPEDLNQKLGALARGDDEVPRPTRAQTPRRLSDKADFLSDAERRRFATKPTIASTEIGNCDLDELARRLQA